MKGWVGTVTIALALVCTCGVAQQDAVDEALDKIATYDWGQSRENLTVVADLVTASAASPEQRDELATKLAGVLSTDATYACKQFVCRQLSLIAGENQVSALAPLLTDEKMSDMARYALEQVRVQAVDEALLDALPKAKDSAKLGIINSMGERRDSMPVDALAGLIGDGDAKVAEAAIAALGKIGGAKAAEALGTAAGSPGPLAEAAADAYLLCGDALQAAGKGKAAAAIYDAMYSDENQPGRIRVAALEGLLTAEGGKGVDLVIAALSSGDPEMRGVAAGLVRELPDPNATKAFAKQVAKSEAPVQVLLLTALADRGDKAALPAITQAAESGEGEVRAAALAALGKVGDASSIGLLARAAASGEGDAQAVAQRSLEALSDPKANAVMMDALQDDDAKIRAELIRALTARGVSDAVPNLLETAKDPDPAVRAASLKALGVLGGTDDLAPLVALLVAAEADAERGEAGKAIVAVARKGHVPAAVTAVQAALPTATASEPQAALLTLLGQIGDDAGLDNVRAGVKSGDAAVQDAAIRALAAWPTATPLDDVFALAENAGREVHCILALRGAIRMLGMGSDRTGEESLALYQKAMGLATRPDEKKMALAGMADVGVSQVLEVVKQYADDPELKAEAEKALDKIRSRSYTASASHNGGNVGKALDKDPGSRWDTGAVQKGGEWFMVDLGWEDMVVTKIVLDSKGSSGDYPRGYKVYLSNNKDDMGDPVAEGKGETPVLEIALKPKLGRYLKIEQTGSSDGLFWSIHELTISTEER